MIQLSTFNHNISVLTVVTLTLDGSESRESVRAAFERVIQSELAVCSGIAFELAKFDSKLEIFLIDLIADASFNQSLSCFDLYFKEGDYLFLLFRRKDEVSERFNQEELCA